MKVAIAGAGAVGRSIARELIENGHDVTLLERNPDHIDVDAIPAAHWRLGDSCELSLLEFQRRVLEEASDPENKLLERVKFLSIVSSNLDEFFMVRVAALKQKLAAGNPSLSIDGKTVTQQLEAIRQSVGQLVQQVGDCFQKQLLPGLEQEGIVIADYAALY